MTSTTIRNNPAGGQRLLAAILWVTCFLGAIVTAFGTFHSGTLLVGDDQARIVFGGATALVDLTGTLLAVLACFLFRNRHPFMAIAVSAYVVACSAFSIATLYALGASQAEPSFGAVVIAQQLGVDPTEVHRMQRAALCSLLVTAKLLCLVLGCVLLPRTSSRITDVSAPEPGIEATPSAGLSATIQNRARTDVRTEFVSCAPPSATLPPAPTTAVPRVADVPSTGEAATTQKYVCIDGRREFVSGSGSAGQTPDVKQSGLKCGHSDEATTASLDKHDHPPVPPFPTPVQGVMPQRHAHPRRGVEVFETATLRATPPTAEPRVADALCAGVVATTRKNVRIDDGKELIFGSAVAARILDVEQPGFKRDRSDRAATASLDEHDHPPEPQFRTPATGVMPQRKAHPRCGVEVFEPATLPSTPPTAAPRRSRSVLNYRSARGPPMRTELS